MQAEFSALEYPSDSAEADAIPASGIARQMLAVLLIVALCDLMIYRGHGYAGIALLLVMVPALLGLGTARPSFKNGFLMIAVMLGLLAVRMVWLGSPLGALCGLGLLVALSIALQGRTPYGLAVVRRAVATVVDGCRGLLDYTYWALGVSGRAAHWQWLAVALPLVVIGFFSALFVLANPDLLQQVLSLLQTWRDMLRSWLREMPIRLREVVFWGAVAWFFVGLLRPRLWVAKAERDGPVERPRQLAAPAHLRHDAFYLPIRNTLLGVIVLFAVYLVFEFSTLWFREFPTGFYYSGYAHQGAFWLTTALAFATLTLSLIFRGSLLEDARLPHLRRLAWIWSAENLLLALTVFNRLHIYVDFNGMTRMRMVALFGTATVVAGFVLVVWKIVRNYDFAWLVQAQILALALAMYVYALTPVDAIVHRYNVRHILAGDLPPAVQIAVHPINSEGVLALLPLLDCKEPVVRDGVRALCAGFAIELESRIGAELDSADRLGWTGYQAARHVCLRKLYDCEQKWEKYREPMLRSTAFEQFYDFAYQWY